MYNSYWITKNCLNLLNIMYFQIARRLFINEAQHARKRLGKNYTEYEHLIDSIKQDEDYYFNEEKLESLANNLGSINSIISSESLSIEGQVDRITKAQRLVHNKKF